MAVLGQKRKLKILRNKLFHSIHFDMISLNEKCRENDLDKNSKRKSFNDVTLGEKIQTKSMKQLNRSNNSKLEKIH